MEYLLSIIALVIAVTSAVISYVLLRLQQDPEIVVYAIPDVKRPTIINLVIENIGKGIARDVTFTSDAPVPQKAFGFEDAHKPDVMTSGPLVRGIAFMPSGDKRIITWGQYGGLLAGLPAEPLIVTAHYRSQPSLRFISKKHQTHSHMDLKSFEGTDVSDHNWDKKTADQLEKIAKTLQSLREPRSSALRVAVSDSKQDQDA